MSINTTEKNLAKLAKRIGIPLEHGWKTKLQRRLNQKKPEILSTWIRRGIPKNFVNILSEAGIDPRIWEKIEESSTAIEVTATENINMADVPKLNETTRPYNESVIPLKDLSHALPPTYKRQSVDRKTGSVHVCPHFKAAGRQAIGRPKRLIAPRQPGRGRRSFHFCLMVQFWFLAVFLSRQFPSMTMPVIMVCPFPNATMPPVHRLRFVGIADHINRSAQTDRRIHFDGRRWVVIRCG